MSAIYIVRGLPGSGKSTYCHTKFPGMFHVENDMAQLTDEGIYNFKNEKRTDSMTFCMHAVRLAIEHDTPVIVSNVFVTRRAIDSYKAIATVHNCPFKVIRLIGNFGNVHDVPKDVYESMKSHFEDYPGEEIIDLSK